MHLNQWKFLPITTLSSVPRNNTLWLSMDHVVSPQALPFLNVVSALSSNLTSIPAVRAPQKIGARLTSRPLYLF